MHRDLFLLKLDTISVTNLCNTVREVYAVTSAVDGSGYGVGGKLRALLTGFTVLCKQDLMKFSSFRSLVTEGGEFVVELLRVDSGKCSSKYCVYFQQVRENAMSRRLSESARMK